jgi:hypothetical protein
MCLVVCAASERAGPDEDRPPEAYVDPVDQQIARTGKGISGRPFPCEREKLADGIRYIEGVALDACVRMSPSQTFRGLWRNEFEGSRFCPAPAQECTFHTNGDKIWLTFPKDLRPYNIEASGGLYELEFVGRQTMHRGFSGHLGVSDHEIIVDRLISMRELQPPPPPPTKAEMEAEWKRCEAAGNCISLEKLEEMQKRKN